MTQKCKRIISWKQILQVRVGLALTNSTDWPARRLLDSRSPWLTSTENNSLQCTIISRWGTCFILSEQYHYDAFLLFDLKYFESLPPKILHHLIIRVDDTSTMHQLQNARFGGTSWLTNDSIFIGCNPPVTNTKMLMTILVMCRVAKLVGLSRKPADPQKLTMSAQS